MPSIERRIAALESQDARPYRWCWRRHGETDADAMARAGIVVGDSVIVFSWREPDANI